MKKTALPTVLLFCCVNAFGQQAVTNKGNIRIFSGANLAVYGNFTNTGTASLSNNGNLYLKSNITNDQPSMSAGSGVLNLNGTTSQTLSGSQSFKTLNLTTNNPSGIVLNADLSVSGLHTFSAGMISTSATPNFLIYESGSSYSGDNDARHVNGWVKKIGSTSFSFPVGSGTFERPIAANGMGSASEFNASYSISTPNTNSMQAPLVRVNQNEYWTLNRIAGSTASVVMNWDNSKRAFQNWYVSEITVANYNGTTWTSQGGTASGTVSTTGTITSNSISSFGLFSLGSKAFPVPLTLVNFSAKRVTDHTNIFWQTVFEQGVDHFELERSDDGISFYLIEKQTAVNSGSGANYQAKDFKLIHGKAFYRLRTVDQNSTKMLSATVMVSSSTGHELQLLTNPVHDKIQLLAGTEMSGSFDYLITAMNGQNLQQGKIPMNNGGQYTMAVNNHIPAGTYMLTVKNGSESFAFKLQVK